MREGSGRILVLVLVVLALPGIVLGGCSATPTTTAPTGTPVGSPVEGVVIDIESEGLSDVDAFTLRTLEAGTIRFTIGQLENGTEFPPAHLAEHLAASTPVRAFFRREGGDAVVYRLEDAEPLP